MRDEFFVEDNLKHMFGIRDVKLLTRIKNDGINFTTASLENPIDIILNYSKNDDSAMKLMEFGFYKMQKNRKVIDIGSLIILRKENNSISFENLQCIFDKPLEIEKKIYLPPLDYAPKTATSPYGNEKYEYNLKSRSLVGRFVFSFFFDGTVNHASFSAKEI